MAGLNVPYRIPGVMPNDEFQEKLKQYTDQLRSTTAQRPAPSSAVGMEDKIAREFAQVPQTQHLAAPTPSAPQGQQGGVQLPPDNVGRSTGPAQDLPDAPVPFGALTEEESVSATAERDAEAVNRVDLFKRAAEARVEMRKQLPMNDPDATLFRDVFGDMVAEGEAQDAAGLVAMEERAKRISKLPPVRQTWWLNAIQSSAKSAALTGLSAVEHPLILTEQIGQLFMDAEAGKSGARQWLQSVEKAIDAALPGDKGRAEDFLTELSSGAGSMTAFMAAGFVGRALGVGSAVTAGVLGAMSQGSSQFRDAEEHSATAFQKWMALILGSALGVTEAIPIDRMFMRMDAATDGMVRRLLTTTAASSMEEFIQETGQYVGENIIAKYGGAWGEGYDPERELDAGDMLKQGVIGAIVGGGASVITQGVGAAVKPWKQDDAPVSETEREAIVVQAIDDLQQVVDGIDGIDVARPNVEDLPLAQDNDNVRVDTPLGSFDVPDQIAAAVGLEPDAATEPVQSIEEFDNPTPETFAKPGWAVVTATREAVGSADHPANLAANDRLKEELDQRGIPYRETRGYYEGEDNGRSFIILADEATATELGRGYMQESVLTNRGYIYHDGSIAPLDPTQTVFSPEAEGRAGYTTMPDGRSFSLGLDFDNMARDPNVSPQVSARQIVQQIGEAIAEGRMRQDPGTVAERLAQMLPRASVVAPQRRVVAAGGTIPQTQADGRVRLTHWSGERRGSISPSFAGTGPTPGPERGYDGPNKSYFGVNVERTALPKRVDQKTYSQLAPDERDALRQLRKFGVNVTRVRDELARRWAQETRNVGYTREGGLGPIRHEVSVSPDELYNWQEDVLGLRDGIDPNLPVPQRRAEYERRIKDAGFSGFYSEGGALGPAVALFNEAVPERVYDDATGELIYEAVRPAPALLKTGAMERLDGLPESSTGPITRVVRAAHAYALSRGLPFRRQMEYVRVDPERAARIAAAYEAMPHDPNNPEVAAAYEAMIEETLAQYQYVKDSGLDIEFIPEGQPDPYAGDLKQVLRDLEQGHLWVFPTDQGFGTLSEAEASNPLLRETNEVADGRRLLVNDVFRIVHDFFGHGLEGSGFGARGEENAWQSHMRLYSEAALPAVTSETRGQNSWVNYGPFGEQNRTDPENTVFADQKTGIMPEWTWREGVAEDLVVESDVDLLGMKSPNPARLDKLLDQVPGFEGVVRYMTEEERAVRSARDAAKIVEIFENLPSAEEMASVAVAGRAKRGWYAASSQAIVDIFGVEDAPRFAALLAALSPQNSVEMNAENTLRVWAAWNNAGRPTDKAQLSTLLRNSVRSPTGNILHSWVPNSIEALSSPDPASIMLSGPKVNSFMLNLRFNVNEVTNDTWMANYALVDAEKTFKGSANKARTNPGKGTGYKAYSARVRQAAEVASQITGETWTPAEIQETVWSFARSLYKVGDAADIDLTELLDTGGLTHAEISDTPDFAVLFTSEFYRKILEAGGYDVSGVESSGSVGDGVDAGQNVAEAPEGLAIDRGTFEEHLRNAAHRLETLRQSSRRAARGYQREVAPPDEHLQNVTDEELDDLYGMIAGENASTTDTLALDRAKGYEKAGYDAVSIYKATGFYRGTDRQWRFEITDADATFRNNAHIKIDNNLQAEGLLGEILFHRKLFEAYPQIAQIRTEIILNPGSQPRGEFTGLEGRILVIARDKTEAMSILLHETQHAVQTVEDFARGGNISMGEIYEGEDVDAYRFRLEEAKAALDDLMTRYLSGDPKVDQQLVSNARDNARQIEDLYRYAAAYEYYRRVAGEVEARNVQDRWEAVGEYLSLAKRLPVDDPRVLAARDFAEAAPFQTEDVRPEDQIIVARSRYGEGFEALAEMPVRPEPQGDLNAAVGTSAAKGAAITETPAFKAWFGDSKVVDDQGKPLVVYHGTDSTERITAFDESLIGRRDAGFYGRGFYFTPDMATADAYTENEDGDPVGSVEAVYLSIQRPFIWDTFTDEGRARLSDAFSAAGLKGERVEEYTNLVSRTADKFNAWMRREGFDGVIRYGRPDFEAGVALVDEIVAFSPEQIKSVHNRGTFDPTNPDIMASVGTSAARDVYTGERTRPTDGIPLQPDQPTTPVENSLQKISRNFIALLDLTARQGRFTLKGSNVMGQYSRRQQVVRLRSWSDLSTLVHEGGHALHDAMDGALKSFTNKNDTELMKVADKLYGRGVLDTAALPKAEHVREGFAELFRVYVLNRAYAEANFPTLTAEFDALLTKEAPDIKTGLDAVGLQFDAYLQAPSVQALGSHIVDGRIANGVEAELAELRELGFRSWMEEWSRRVLQMSINRYASLNKVVTKITGEHREKAGKSLDLKRAQDPRVLARLAPNAGARATVQLSDGVMGYNSLTPISRGLRDAMLISQGMELDATAPKFDDDRMHDFSTYLVGLRLLDEYRRYSEGKLSRPPANMSEGDIRQAITDLEAQYGASFTDAAQIAHEYGMALWQKQYDAGLMSKETYLSGLDRTFYVPLQRDMSDKARDFSPNAVTGGRSLVKRFKGSDRAIVDPLSILMHKTYSLEQTIAQNEVVKALALLADRAGGAGALVERIPASKLMGQQFSVEEVAKLLTKDDTLTDVDAQDLMTILSSSIEDGNYVTLFRPKQATEAGENVVFFWENGKVAAIQIEDGDVGADVVNMLNGLGRETMNLGMDIIAGTTSMFRAAITKWPDFIVVNYIRDQLSAWMLTDVGYIPFVSGAKGLWAEVRQKQVARDANAAMMLMGGMNVAALHEARVNRDLNSLRGKGYLPLAFLGHGSVWKNATRGFARLTEMTETGTRLGLFEKAFQRGKRDGLNEWDAAIEASYIATDYIDFGLNGNRMLTARRTIPFLNAQLQGLYKMIRTLGGDEVRQQEGLAFVMKAYLKGTNGLELSRTERDAINTGRKLMLKMVSISLLGALLWALFEDDPDYQDTSEYLRATGWVIPVGDGQIAYIPKPFELAMFSNIVERGLEMASGDGEAVNRLVRGAAMNLMPPTAPPLISTFVEWYANRDFFSGREVIPSHMQALAPQLQYSEYTSTIAREIGRVTGWSPMAVDHFMSGMGASAFRDIQNITNAFDPTKPEMADTDVPVLRRFFRDVRRGAASTKDFWDQVSQQQGKISQAAMTYKRFIEQGQVHEAERFLESVSEDEKVYALLDTHFKVEHKRLNPYRRARDIATVVSGMRREINSELGLEDTSKFADEPSIPLTASAKRQIDTALSEYARREARNSLVVMKHPGWHNNPITDVEKTLEIIELLSPDTAEELERRLTRSKVNDAAAVYDLWPEVRDRIITDREEAYLDDLVVQAKRLP